MAEIVRHGVTRRWSDLVLHQGVAYFVEVPEDPTADLRGQIEQVFQQIEQRLRLVDSDKTRLLQVLIYLPEASDLMLFNELWEQWLPEGSAPSRACVHAPLAAKGYRLELVLTAAAGKRAAETGA